MAKMSADSLKNNLTNPARTYLWEVLIPNPGEGDTETYLLRAQSSEIPERGFGEILIPFKQSAGIKFPGKIQYPQKWDVTFVESEDRQIMQDVYDWMNNIIHDRFQVGNPVIKTDIYFNLINTDGSIAKKIRLVGTYPERMSNVAMDADSEDACKFTTTFSYDRWELV